MKSFNQLLEDWDQELAKGRQVRFGQYFCNTYIRQSWPTLYYADYVMAAELIFNWLKDHQYEDELPKKLRNKQ
jgi:hypothetical protein